MEYRLFGPLEVVSNGTRVDLGPPKQRALLAVLLLHADEIVPTDRLIEEVWGDHRPRTAAHSVQLYVSDLRKALEPLAGGPVIETRPPGYVLRVEPADVDLRRFDRLVAEADRARSVGDVAGAASMLEDALRLCRGAPLAEFAYQDFAQPEIRRLEELRLHATEELAAAELELGRAQGALTLLEEATARDPLRERPRELQMLALYRAGRHAEALRTYQRSPGSSPRSSGSTRRPGSAASRSGSCSTTRRSCRPAHRPSRPRRGTPTRGSGRSTRTTRATSSAATSSSGGSSRRWPRAPGSSPWSDRREAGSRAR